MRRLFFALSIGALVSLSACSSAVPAGLVPVDGGKFKMGYNGGRADLEEKPEHDAEVEGFYIGRTEVTNAEYMEFVTDTKHAAPANWTNGQVPAGKERFPVSMVSWDDASAYCKWRGGRLPTEPEWEYAARGKDNRLYPWGNDWAPNKANNFEAGKNGPVAVSSFAAGTGPFGTCDQAGNVWEWTSTPAKGPGQFVIKGGSYKALEDRPRASLRTFAQKDRADESIGFRMAANKD